LSFSSDLLREKMMEEKMLRPVRKVLAKYYREDIQINCMVGSKAASESEAVDILPNGLVDLTLRELGGRVRKTTNNHENEKKE